MIHLVAIGFLSEYEVYINLTREEAIQRHDRERPDWTVAGEKLDVKEFDVTDHFRVYDIWKSDL